MPALRLGDLRRKRKQMATRVRMEKRSVKLLLNVLKRSITTLEKTTARRSSNQVIAGWLVILGSFFQDKIVQNGAPRAILRRSSPDKKRATLEFQLTNDSGQ